MKNNALYDYLAVDLLPYENTGSVERQFAVGALKKTLLKKFQDDVDTRLTDAVAINKFLAMNLRCNDWSYSPETLLDEMLLGAFEKRCRNFFERGFDYSLEYYIERGRFGPGASVGANGYDFFTKIGSGPLTATSPGIYRAYDNYVSTIPYWRTAELIRVLSYGEVNVVPGSVLQCVPKNDSTSRTICTEPTLNMFAQLGVGSVIETLLKERFEIDLSTQPGANAELARLGSLTGNFFTIDLESASDTISLKMLERFLPRGVLSLLKALRSANTRMPDGRLQELHMVSSMGNGFTFPLQTALFACALLACSDVCDHELGLSHGYTEYRGKNWGCFGDDIVGPERLYNKMSRLLHLLGFIVNEQKSFNHGKFRESCGADYYNGVNVRGVYLKSLKTQASRYVAINLLNRWSARHGIPLTYTLGYLCKKVQFLPVPLHESDDSGIKLPLTLVEHRIMKSYGTGAQLYHYRKLVNRPYEMRTLENGEVVSPRGTKKRISNPAALLTAFLGGYVRNGVILLRQLDGARPGTRRGATPHWDYISDAVSNPHVEPVSQQVLYQRLVTASVLNFSSYLK